MDGLRRGQEGRGRRLVVVAGVLLLIGLMAAACAGAASAPSFAGSAPEFGPAAQTPAGAPAAAPNNGSATKGQAWSDAQQQQPLDQAITEQTQIVKTGSMSLEVADLDKAVSQAQASIEGLGGYVSASQRAGSKNSATANVTYRVPVAAWDKALGALRGLGTKVISEQTSTTDVTGQVIDMDARLDNLQATEKALQGIMARAVQISDVLAVQQQLTQVQGQIEQLTAQRDHLKNQAAMSTLSVSFQLPAPPDVTQAASGWSAGKVVDEAVAALVNAGQGIATAAIWLAIVVLPLGIGLLVVVVILLFVLRRLGLTRRPLGTPSGEAS